MADPLPFTIRPARADDAPVLGYLGALLVRLHHGFDTKRFLAPRPETEEGYSAFLASELRREAAIVLVAEREGTVIGYVYATLEGSDWMSLRGPAGAINDLLVDPKARREGVGRKLMIEMLATLQARGASQMVLSTATQNEAAQALFASLGFRSTMIEMTRETRA